ncbi:MAG: response regulator [Cytophagales bacterium]|nr:response regulator [Cytophagales bacterium]
MLEKGILLIDDNKVTSFILSRLIERTEENCKLKDCGTAYEALKCLEECEPKGEFPHIIFLDINMPIMDGFDFLDKYMEQYFHSHPQTQVIVFTSSIMPSDRAHAAQYPCVSDFVLKPITEEKLREILAMAEV